MSGWDLVGGRRSLLGGRRNQNRQIHSVCRQYTANIDAALVPCGEREGEEGGHQKGHHRFLK